MDAFRSQELPHSRLAPECNCNCCVVDVPLAAEHMTSLPSIDRFQQYSTALLDHNTLPMETTRTYLDDVLTDRVEVVPCLDSSGSGSRRRRRREYYPHPMLEN